MPKPLLVLCAYLLVWVPANFALLAGRSLPSLEVRGVAATIELSAHAIVALSCVVAGWMLRAGNSAGRRCAVAALMGNAAASVHSLYASRLPHDVQPGLVTPLVIVLLMNTGVWIIYLFTSKRLRIWLEG